MPISIHILTDLIHIIKIVLLCESFFMFEKREGKCKWLKMTVLLIFMSIVSTFIYFCDNEAIIMSIYIVAIILFLYVLYRDKITSLFISALWIITIMSMLDTMTIILIEMLGELSGIKVDCIVDVLAGVVSLAIVYIVGNIYSKQYVEGVKNLGLMNLILFTLLTMADTFVVMMMATIEVYEKYEIQGLLNSIAFVIVIIGIFIQLGAVILLFMQRNLYKEKKQITEKYLNEQISHYEYLEQREIETKRFRHDLRNHMQMLSNLAHNGQHNKIDDYLDAMNVKIESFGNVITVQNGIADAIINQSYSRAEQDGIKMDIKGRFPRECAVEAYDLCTILSNVLNNALEAAVKSNEKRISIDCRYNDKNIILVVKNTYKDVGQFENGKFKTSKEDMDYHGYGLINIKESLNKYNGVLDVETDGEVFTLKISLNYTEKREYEDSGHR